VIERIPTFLDLGRGRRRRRIYHQQAFQAGTLTIDKNPSFGNGMHIYNDYIRTIYFLEPGIFVEILSRPHAHRDKDHTDQPAGISWLWFWVYTGIFFVGRFLGRGRRFVRFSRSFLQVIPGGRFFGRLEVHKVFQKTVSRFSRRGCIVCIRCRRRLRSACRGFDGKHGQAVGKDGFKFETATRTSTSSPSSRARALNTRTLCIATVINSYLDDVHCGFTRNFRLPAAKPLNR